MDSTMTLLDKALALNPAPYWHEKLGLNRNALHNARMRGHISPAIAGALAEELGEEPQKWIVVAALESERDSTCKELMVKRFSNWKKQKQLPEVTGKERVRTIFDYVVDSLDERDSFEAEAKRVLIAIVNSLPDAQEQAPETKKPLQALGSQGVSWRKRNHSNFIQARFSGLFAFLGRPFLCVA
jgi:hypothetical protein